MQDVTISITRKNIYEFVTSLTGALGRQKGDYDKYVCLPDNYAVLDRFMDTAIAVVEDSIYRRLARSNNFTLQWHNENLTITLLSNTIPERLHGAIFTNIRLAIAYLLAAMWLQGIDVELYANFAKVADAYIDSALSMSLQKDSKNIDYSPTKSDDQDSRTKVGDTGVSNIKPDDIPATIDNAGCIGKVKRDECHINKHSRFDTAVYWPDGSVMSF